MKKQPKSYIFYLGIALFALGLLLTALLAEREGALAVLPHVLVGFGAGITGVGVVNLFRLKLIMKDPEKARQLEIEEKDERNIRLREKAGYATWYLTLFTLAALSLTLLILDYKTACLLAFGVLLTHAAALFIWIYVYNERL
jgi:uncharacterized membrane protein